MFSIECDTLLTLFYFFLHEHSPIYFCVWTRRLAPGARANWCKRSSKVLRVYSPFFLSFRQLVLSCVPHTFLSRFFVCSPRGLRRHYVHPSRDGELVAFPALVSGWALSVDLCVPTFVCRCAHICAYICMYVAWTNVCDDFRTTTQSRHLMRGTSSECAYILVPVSLFSDYVVVEKIVLPVRFSKFDQPYAHPTLHIQKKIRKTTKTTIILNPANTRLSQGTAGRQSTHRSRGHYVSRPCGQVGFCTQVRPCTQVGPSTQVGLCCPCRWATRG